MTHASLFSGIGGPEVAAEMLGWTNLFHCEINPFGRAVLAYHFPESVSYEDITKTDFTQWRGRVDVLTGGFPCQPFSYAGKRGGADDDRYLWPQMCRAIQECQPTWVVGENVAGLATMVEQCEITELGAQPTLFEAVEAVPESLYEERGRYTIDRICQDLEAIGYAVQPVLIPACGVGAPHRRDRIFIIGFNTNASHNRLEYTTNGESKGKLSKEVQREECNAELHISAPADGCGRTTADTESRRDSGRTTEVLRETGRPPELNAEPVIDGGVWTTADTDNTRNRASDRQSGREGKTMDGERQDIALGRISGLGDRWQRFPSVSAVHRGNDGIPFRMDDLTIPFAQWRTESLKAYGNAIVPQVMYEIFRAIEEINPIV